MQLNLVLISLFVLPQAFSAQSKAYKRDQKRTWSEANYFYEMRIMKWLCRYMLIFTC